MAKLSLLAVIVATVAILCSFSVQEIEGQVYQRQEDPNKLLVSTILGEPYLRVKKGIDIRDRKLYNEDYEGYTWDLAYQLARELAFSDFEFMFTNEYGRKADNGSDVWSGIVGDIINNRAHLGIGPLTITKERSTVVDFSTPFLQFQYGILVTKHDMDDDDDDDHDGQLLFFEPFTVWLWLLIIGTSLVLLFLIFFIEKFVSLKLQGDDRSKNEKLFHHFCSRVFGTPRSIATRILQVSFWIWVIVIFSAYTANFAANRFIDLIQDADPDDDNDNGNGKIDSLKDIIGNEKINYGIIAGGSTNNFFKNSKTEIYQRMYKEMIEDDTFKKSQREGVAAVENGNGSFAFIGETPTLKYTTLQQPCNLALAPLQFGPKIGFGVASSISNPVLSKRVNFIILELKERGVLEDLEQKWFTDRSQCVDDDDEDGDGDDDDDDDDWSKLKLKEHEPLDLASMAGAFYFLLIAILIFIIIAAIELHLIAKFRKQV